MGTISRYMSYTGALILVLSLAASSQVIRTQKGPVEFLGLKKWTIKMISDSLEVYAPGGHGLWGCAAELTSKLHFANSSVVRYPDHDTFYTVITVLEPEDSAWIDHRAPMKGESPLLPLFTPLDALFKRDNYSFQLGLISYGLFRNNKIDSARSYLKVNEADTVVARHVWSFLSAHATEDDMMRALWVSLHDPNPMNRALANAMLANFPGFNMTWWTLFQALLDPVDLVAGTARQTLASLIESAPGRLDWMPVAPTIRYLLQGSNLFALETVLKVLVRTQVSPEISTLVLNPRSRALLLANFHAVHRDEREAAYHFLSQLSGIDPDRDQSGWLRWIETFGLEQ